MTTLVHFIGALAASLLGVLYLLQIDEKRNRVYRLRRTLSLPRSRLAGWALVVLPAIVLIAIGQLSAFLAWLGALTVVSWLIVSRVPHHGDEQIPG